jgi:hypothetical protein
MLCHVMLCTGKVGLGAGGERLTTDDKDYLGTENSNKGPRPPGYEGR